jgi:hypothetical protein
VEGLVFVVKVKLESWARLEMVEHYEYIRILDDARYVNDVRMIKFLLVVEDTFVMMIVV